MRDEEINQVHARHMVILLSNFFIKKKRFMCLCVQVDFDMPQKSDEFLLSCGFKQDCHADFLTLESALSEEKRKLGKQKYSIVGYNKVYPETEKPFMAYDIKINETGEIVHKRFREFFKLWKRLKENLHGSNIPKCPKKKFFGNMNEEFIEKRKKKLENWLNAVSNLPGIEESGWLENFVMTELKIRGVKPISEEQKFIDILNRNKAENTVDRSEDVKEVKRTSNSQKSKVGHGQVENGKKTSKRRSKK